MAELEIPGVAMNQEYRVKLGKSFTIARENAFHTIKYDFKPLSVDNSKPGKLRVGEGDEVNMSLPVVQAESADDVAQFRGPKRPCTRECVLIINTETGEAILEKIGSSVNLKSVRDGRPKPARDRSVSPAPFASKTQAMSKMAQQGKPPVPSASSSSSSSSHKHSKVSKPPTKSRPKKSSEAGGGVGGGSGTSLKHSQTAGSGGGGEALKTKMKQSNYPNHGPSAHSDVQQSSAHLSLPKLLPIPSSAPPPAPPVQTSNESNPFNQGGNHQLDGRKRTLEESSGSSSGSASSSSSGSSDSESEDESPVQPSFPSAAYPSGGGVNVPAPGGGGVMNMPSMQPQHTPPNRVPPSMPVFGGGSSGVAQGSVHPFPVQPPARNEDSSSSSGSDSESSSDSSSGSSSDSSDTEAGKGQAGPAAALAQQPPPHFMRSISTLEHELCCSSSDSD